VAGVPPAYRHDELRTLQVVLIDGERTLGSATVQLLGSGAAGELKPEIFGFEAGPEETIDFAVRPNARKLLVRAIRVGSRWVDPSRTSQRAKVAIKAFRFLPGP
jgi:hypothetical protein